MTTRPVNPHRIALLPTGTITFIREGYMSAQKWVYQRVGKGFGNIPRKNPRDLQLRRHVIPADPRTAAQLSRRSLFANAVAAWQALDPAAKQPWSIIGRPRSLPGYQMFLSNYLDTTTAPWWSNWDGVESVWDSGASAWDGGASLWDALDYSVWDSGSSVWDLL